MLISDPLGLVYDQVGRLDHEVILFVDTIECDLTAPEIFENVTELRGQDHLHIAKVFELTLVLDVINLMVNLVQNHIEVFRFDLAGLFELFVVFGELSEHVVFAMVSVDFEHEIGVAGSIVDQLFLDIVQVLLDLSIDDMDVTRVDIVKVHEQVQCHVAARHVVLKHVVNERDIVVDPPVHEAPDAAQFLVFQRASEQATCASKVVQKLPVVQGLVGAIKRLIDGVLEYVEGLSPHETLLVVDDIRRSQLMEVAITDKG